MRPIRSTAIALIVAVLAVVVVTDQATAAKRTKAAKAPKGVFPIAVKDSRGPVTIAKRPVRIVSLSPTATESLFAVGAGKQVVAVDDQSNYPAGTPMTKLSGFQPNLEAIAGYKPDLVVIANDPKELAAGLAKLKIPVLLLSAATSFDDAYREIEVLGAVTGHVADAAVVVSNMRSDIAKLTAGVAKRPKPLTFFHELDNTLYSVTSKTFIGSLYSAAGLTNIADAADKTSGGYPQLTNEYVISQNPDLIFLADTKCCKQDAQAVAARPGWGELAAVKGAHVVDRKSVV